MLRLCDPGSGFLSKPIADKRKKLKDGNVTMTKINFCIEEMKKKIIMLQNEIEKERERNEEERNGEESEEEEEDVMLVE